MKTVLITWLACLTFALYNAYGIRGLENSWQWHILQLISIVLFVFSDIGERIKYLYDFWKWRDFHNFGRYAWRFGFVAVVAVAIYVESLHYFLGLIK